MRQIAIIGPTASGKTSLCLTLANKLDAEILSLDSLSIYKDIDIASAKPNKEQLASIKHHGINIISPNQKFDITMYSKLYTEVYSSCKSRDKNLIIAGGSSFYLKTLIDGISQLPTIDNKTKQKTKEMMCSLPQAYKFLTDMDPQYMSNIEQNDTYRIEKMLNIHYQTNLSPTEYFALHKPEPTINKPIEIYEIQIDKEVLDQNIITRTKQMLDIGIIDEVATLEKRYTRAPNCMKSIGIKETLDYLDGVYNKDKLIDKIATNTRRLAKRQKTFNKSQFANIHKDTDPRLYETILTS